MGFLDGMKVIFEGRDKTVQIRKFLYEKLLEQAGSDEEAERLLNQILAQRFESIEKEREEKEEEMKLEESLSEYYNALDRYLYATLNSMVEIGITNRLVGQETSYCRYELTDYELNKKYKTLTLDLVRNGERYPISFDAIKDIKFNDLGNRLKTWIYMPNPIGTWRFYLSYDAQILNKVIDDPKFESGRFTTD